MRIRPLIVLSAIAVTGVLLAGCSGPNTSSPTSSPTTTAAAGLCGSAAQPGSVSDAVKVGGKDGAEPTVSFTAPVEVPAIQRTVVTEGTGDKVAEGDMVRYAIASFDAKTGKKIGSAGFGEGAKPLTQASAAGTGQFFGCATVGTRIVLAIPAASGGDAQIDVLDVVETIPDSKWCQPTTASGAKPTVKFDGSGKPTISVPTKEKAPADMVVDVLKQGDGAVVKSGDSVTVNYTGVKWSDGTVFDSSWEKGQPATFKTTEVVVGFKRALEGQKVGSTILAVLPPACGYGETASAQNALAGQTLVFVLTIESTKAG